MSSIEKEASIQLSNKERSFRSTPPVYAPSFFISHGSIYQNQTFCIPCDGSYHVRSVPEMRGMLCVGSAYGWLILKCLNKKPQQKCHLFNPVTLTKIKLPDLPDGLFEVAVLSCPPSDPTCVVMFFHINDEVVEDESGRQNLCIFCRIGDETWIEQKLSNDFLRHPEAVSSKEKIYLSCYPWMLVIDVQDNVACIEQYDLLLDRHFFTVHPAAYYDYILESCGDIFLIKAIRVGLSIIVQEFLVFKLDLSKMAWQHVESIGNRIFLLGDNSDSVSLAPSEFGAKGNCMYFFGHGWTELYCFDMEVETITVTQPCPTKFPTWDGPFWVVPNCKVQVKKQVAEATKEFQVISSDFPQELLSMIFESLCLGDCIRFRLACKASISMASPIRSFPLQILPDSQHLPWLISLPNTKKKSICHLYHPIYTDAYTMSLPQLAGAIVRHANFGWLLLSSAHTSHFFLNPSTLETVQLPCSMRGFLCISFSAPPTSSDCVVFGHSFISISNYVDMSVYRKTQNSWSRHLLSHLPYTFVPATCNPVFRNDAFYCLSRDGKLGVFNPNATNEEDMWMVYTDLSFPDVWMTLESKFLFTGTRSFIMDCDSGIFSVFVGFLGNVVRVYKLDQSKTKMKWVKVRTLGKKVMFLSHTVSLLIPAGLNGTENRIYFPRFKENAIIFYSLKSKKYNCFGKQYSCGDWLDTSEHWNCTWFEGHRE